MPLRLRRFWVAGAASLIAGLIYLSSLPAADVPNLGVGDFAEHTAGYLVVMLWLAGLLASARWLVAAGALLLLGVALEWLQGAMALGRVADPMDALANGVGVALGLALARIGLGDWMRWVEARVLRG